ncbi:MAG: putative 2-aminoethylphosphonate ABC transporter ATP-binding protein [Burkholderiales bacterium]
MTPHLSVRNVGKRFGAFTALKDVSLDVAAGEFVCFLGPSGCGKTTLLRAIAGLDRQDEGRILIGGRDVSNLPPAARDFGIVFQSYALFPNLTVAENIGFGLVNRRTDPAAVRRRVSELLETIGLPEQAAKYPVQLSGGQQQRVALARALATSPSLLLLDEPLSALDARVRLRLRDELKALQRRLGITTIMVTHDQDEALGLADRMVVMNQGVIEQVGTPRQIYGEPGTAFVADFVGTMNFVPCESVDGDRVRVGTMEIRVARPHGLGTGRAARLGIRPEAVRVHSHPNGFDNSMLARVDEVGFHGGFVRASLAPLAAPDARIAADLSTGAAEAPGLAPGAELPISLPPERLRVFGA